jgi:hypothetical protein
VPALVLGAPTDEKGAACSLRPGRDRRQRDDP